jgi:hypothetical protein
MGFLLPILRQSGLGVDWDEDDQSAYIAEFKIGPNAPNN